MGLVGARCRSGLTLLFSLPMVLTLFLICFPISCSTVHPRMLCCLGNGIRGRSQPPAPGERSGSTHGAFRAARAVLLVFSPSAHSLVLTQQSCSDPFVSLLGYGIREGGELSIFQRCHHHHHVQVAGGVSLRPLACKCLIDVPLNRTMLSAGHLGQQQ